MLQPVQRRLNVKGLVVLPKRWTAERTFARIVWHGSHCKDYGRTTQSGEAMIHITTISLMVRPAELAKTQLKDTFSFPKHYSGVRLEAIRRLSLAPKYTLHTKHG